MREIKFRGKYRLPFHEIEKPNMPFWVYGSLIIGEEICDIVEPDGTIRRDILPDTVGQFTGLHDANGKEIYEGDIVKMTTAAFGDEIFRIGYENSHIGAFCLCSDEQEDTCRFVGIFGRNYGYEPFYCEVIGNIYDNHQLLKGGEI